MNPTSGSVYGVVKSDYISAADISGGDTSYVLPRQLGSGSTRGTQTVGYGNVKIDGSNDQIVIGDTTNTNVLTLGSIFSTVNQTGVASSSINSTNGGFGFNLSTGTSATVNIGTNLGGTTGVNVAQGKDTISLGTTANGIGLNIIEGTTNTTLSLGTSPTKGLQMIFNDGSTNRLLIGQNQAGDEVVWVSAIGVDVTKANPNLPGQLIFNSSQDIFKIIKSDIADIPSASNIVGPFWSQTVSVSVAHNLGFVPAVVAFSFSNSIYEPFVSGTNTITSSIYTDSIGSKFFADSARMTTNVEVNSTTVVFSITYQDLAGNTYDAVPIKYYLLQETAS